MTEQHDKDFMGNIFTEIRKEHLTKQDQFYIDNPEERGYAWNEAGIRCMIEIKKLREELEALKKEVHG